MDNIDRRILEHLQRDACATVAEIGRAVGLSATPCWKRIQKLEAEGVIAKRVAVLPREKVGLNVGVQVFIQCKDHAPAVLANFIDKVRAIPEVLEFRRLAGDFDFALRIVAVDVRHYDQVYQQLAGLMAMRRVASYFELAELKSETALPLQFAPRATGVASRLDVDDRLATC